MMFELGVKTLKEREGVSIIQELMTGNPLVLKQKYYVEKGQNGNIGIFFNRH